MGSIDTHFTPPSPNHHRRHRRRATAAVVAIAALAMTACGSDQDAGTESMEMAADDSADAIAGGGFEEGAMEDAAPATGGVAADGVPVALDERDIITSVGLTMSTSDVRRTAEDVRRITATSGGIVFSSDVFLDDARDDGSVPGGGQIVIKVAPSDLDQLVTDLDGAGVVTRLSQDAEDVTDQLVDLGIRIRQAETGIARIELLLEDAVALDDVFEIENELNRRQVELEQLRAAERNTDNLVALATLTVQIEYRTPAALEEIAEPDDGIGDAFADGWNAFVGALFALGYVLAITAPFLVTLLFVLVVAWLLGRRWSRRQAIVREQRRQDADVAGDRTVPQAHRGTPPPPVAAQRVLDDAPTARATDHAEGDTLVTDEEPAPDE